MLRNYENTTGDDGFHLFINLGTGINRCLGGGNFWHWPQGFRVPVSDLKFISKKRFTNPTPQSKVALGHHS